MSNQTENTGGFILDTSEENSQSFTTEQQDLDLEQEMGGSHRVGKLKKALVRGYSQKNVNEYIAHLQYETQQIKQQLEKQIEGLLAEKRTVTQECDYLHSQVKECEKKLQKANAQLENMVAPEVLEEANEKVAALERHLAQAEDELNNLDQIRTERDRLEAVCADNANMINHLEQSYTDTKIEQERLTRQNRLLEVALRGSRESVADEIQKLSAENRTLEDAYESLRKQLETYNEAARVSEEEKEKLIQLEQQLEQERALLETQREALLQEKEKMDSVIQSVNNQQLALQQKEEEIHSAAEALTQREADIQNAENTLRQREAAVMQSEEPLMQREAELRQVEETLTQREASIQQAEEALTQQEASIQQAEEALTQREASIQQAEEALTQREASIQQAEEVLEQREAAIQQAEEALTQREASVQQAEEVLTQRQTLIQDAEIELTQRQAAVQQAEETLTESQMHVQNAETELAQREAAVQEAEEILEQERTALAAKETEIAAGAEGADMNEQSSDGSQKSGLSEKESKRVQENLYSLYDAFTQMMESLELKSANMDRLLNKMQDDQPKIDELLSQQQSLRDENANLQEARNADRGRISELEAENERLTKELQSKMHDEGMNDDNLSSALADDPDQIKLPNAIDRAKQILQKMKEDLTE